MRRGPVLTLVAVVLGGVALWGGIVAWQPDPVTSPVGAANPVASSAPPPPGPRTVPPVSNEKVDYVGYVDTGDDEVPIAVTVQSGKAKAYVCDGRDVEAWLQGDASGDRVTAQGRNGNTMSASVTPDGVEGSMRLAGKPEWRFSTPRSDDDRAGAYRRVRDGEVSGWVVQDGDRQTGLTRAADGSARPAARLAFDGSVPAGAVPVDGTTDVLARR